MGILEKYIKEKEYYASLNLCKTCEEILKTNPRCLTGRLCEECLEKYLGKSLANKRKF